MFKTLRTANIVNPRSHDWFILDKQRSGFCGEYQCLLWLHKYTRWGDAALDLLIFGVKFKPLKSSGYYMYHKV